MQDKLKELIDRLYEEGLSKGKSEGENILNEARAQAEKILSEAKEEAGHMLDDARKKAEDMISKTQSDITMAASQALQTTKKEIEDLLLSKISSDEIENLLKNPEFLKSIITEVAKRFSAEQSADIALVLPDALKEELEPFVATELKKALDNGIEAGFSKKIKGGFTIGPKDGSYFVSMTDEDFKELICEYLRPATKKLLFG